MTAVNPDDCLRESGFIEGKDGIWRRQQTIDEIETFGQPYAHGECGTHWRQKEASNYCPGCGVKLK